MELAVAPKTHAADGCPARKRKPAEPLKSILSAATLGVPFSVFSRSRRSETTYLRLSGEKVKAVLDRQETTSRSRPDSTLRPVFGTGFSDGLRGRFGNRGGTGIRDLPRPTPLAL
jgi:hypothetical protein